jgi:ABC-type transport system involved in multi-copper enzyme maturation permease subunit
VTGFLRGLWVVTTIELRQRVRGVAWYVLLGVFVALILLVTFLTTLSLSYADEPGAGLYSTIIYFVLLLGTLVTPALSGNAVNGDRDNGTLATTQVTLVSTPQLVLGKFLAAWITALAFLVAALPFLVFSFVLGGARPETVVVSIVVLALELGVVAAVGVGLSGIVRRPLFSIVVTYLVVALLSIGTLIGFTLGGMAVQSRVTVTDRYLNYETGECTNYTYESSVPRFDRVWWMLAANPYVVVADAVPTQFDSDTPNDLFGLIKLGVRGAQQTPDLDGYSDCTVNDDYPTPKEIIDSSVPAWFVGLGIHLALGAGALWGAIALTHAPSRRLAAGSRVA